MPVNLEKKSVLLPANSNKINNIFFSIQDAVAFLEKKKTNKKNHQKSFSTMAYVC